MTPATLETAVYGEMAAPVLHLADKHGILAQLVADGPQTAAALAARLDVDADTVERLLLVLVAFGVVLRADGGAFRVAPDAAAFLDPTDPCYVGGFVEHFVTGTPQRLEWLEACLRNGAGATEPYHVVYRDEAATGDFMRAMWGLSYGVSRELAALAGLDGHRVLVDVGGANGPFAVAALHEAPELRAVVFDLPPVRPYLERSRDEHGLTGRLAFVAGDFFTEELPEGDVMALGYVLSNWTDEECVALLDKAYRACAPGGKVLVMDRLFHDARTGPIATAVMNLAMRVETRGRHRTAAEFRALLERAGFTDCAVRLSTQDKHLVVGCR
jgi:ubiquinone/menaquinone biosynthesis C-methylase UbiE